MALSDTSKPTLATGCRWSHNARVPDTEPEATLLSPEGAIKVEGTGLAILALCDGQRTFPEILEELRRQYFGADPARIREDANRFLEQLHEKRVLDY